MLSSKFPFRRNELASFEPECVISRVRVKDLGLGLGLSLLLQAGQKTNLINAGEIQFRLSLLAIGIHLLAIGLE